MVVREDELEDQLILTAVGSGLGWLQGQRWQVSPWQQLSLQPAGPSPACLVFRIRTFRRKGRRSSRSGGGERVVRRTAPTSGAAAIVSSVPTA